MDKLVEYLCIIQARVNSSRLPSKVMLDLAGQTLLERVYETVLDSKKINKIIIATSTQTTDDIIELKLKALNIECYRGDLDNVLKRFYDTALMFNAKNIIRITADNPLMDGKIIDNLISIYESKDIDYCSFTNAVYGLSAEVFSFESLQTAYNNARDNFDREHVTPYIIDNCLVYTEDVEEKYRKPELSATVDTLDDYIKINKFYMYCNKNNILPNIDNYITHQIICLKEGENVK